MLWKVHDAKKTIMFSQSVLTPLKFIKDVFTSIIFVLCLMYCMICHYDKASPSMNYLMESNFC